jgi:hypothetical protein
MPSKDDFEKKSPEEKLAGGAIRLPTLNGTKAFSYDRWPSVPSKLNFEERQRQTLLPNIQSMQLNNRRNHLFQNNVLRGSPNLQFTNASDQNATQKMAT